MNSVLASAGNITPPANKGVAARALSKILSDISFGSIDITLPDGQRLSFAGRGDGPSVALRIRNSRFLYRLPFGGHTAFFEGFRRGDWTTPNLFDLLVFGELNKRDGLKRFAPPGWRTRVDQLQHALNRNSRRGSRRNVASHYDLGNSFYRQWLDPGMTYSSALFDESHMTLEAAQRNKYMRLAKALELNSGEEVLEIGCGWGGFAELAAKEFGCRVVCLTLSREQANWARNRISAAGLSDQVEIRLQDYREVTGRFDKIVSIEMVEAVGEEFWSRYFSILHDRLKPGGRAAIQSITIKDDLFDSYRCRPDFIQQYIFPGGMLPSPQRLREKIEQAKLSLTDSFYFGESYTRTLQMWNERFLSNWDGIASLGFDASFRRLWTYYLNYCAVGFSLGKIDVGHFLISRE